MSFIINKGRNICFMKKIALLLLGAVALMGCEKVSVNDSIKDEQTGSILPETEVFVSGRAFAYTDTYSGTKGYLWPYANTEEGWESARFSIRIDQSYPGYVNQNSELYFGRKANRAASAQNDKNRGEVWTNYPYGHYNDRDFDYYKIDKSTGNNVGMFRYVSDINGLKTQLAIKKAPSVYDFLEEEKSDLQALIAANKKVAENTWKLGIVDSLLALGEEHLNSHVAWYVVKEVGGKGLWHVNGIMVDTVVGKPDNTPDNVEIDIHQQQHLEWSEIKTSVHIRADVDSIKINIPLSIDEMVEQDDFDIRIFKDYISSDATDFSDAEIKITHNDKGITIVIRKIDFEAIKKYKSKFGDGLTVEIFSYTTSDNTSKVWDEIKKSRVVSIGKSCTVQGQITSAYYGDKALIYAP
jgi:hypothetical protein